MVIKNRTMTEYLFQHLPRGSVDLTRRDLFADVRLFSNDETPLSDLVTIINECNSDLTAICYEYAPGPLGNAHLALSHMLNYAVRGSVRNTACLVAASQFFGIGLLSEFSNFCKAVSFQSLSVIEFILSDYEETYATKPDLSCYSFDQDSFVRKEAQKNPSPYVYRLIEYYYLAAPQDRRMHLKKWRQVMTQPYLDTLQQLSRSSDCHLAYLVPDIRHYLIEPYLSNFLLYV